MILMLHGGPASRGGRLAGAAAAAVILLVGGARGEDAKAPPTQTAKTGCDAACARDAVPAAVQACAPRIERQAPTDFEWMNRPAGTIFQQAEPPSGAGTVVKFRGDSVRFLNPAGQWVRVTYECDYDTAGPSVRDVKVRLGRIDGKGANVAAAPPAATAAQAAPAQGAQAPVKKPKPSEPSDVEIRQVSPTARK